MSRLPLRTIFSAFVAATLTLRGAAAQEAHGTRRALLVGCTEYPALAALAPETYATSIRLAGPANDVALMAQVLEGALEFAPDELRQLVGWPDDESRRPTRARILAELDELTAVSGPGDFALVYFAGHGTQQPTRERDLAREPDGLDEVLLPADVADWDGASGSIRGAIRDDEIGQALRRIRDRGADVWLVVDACHSGSLLRGDEATGGVRLRGLDPTLLHVPASTARRQPSAATAAFDDSDYSHIAAFHGAQSHGRAPELAIDVGDGERVHGLFTWLLAAEIERSRGHTSYSDLIARVVAAYQAWPCQTTVPGAIGGDLERTLFDGEGGDAPWLVVRTPQGFELDRGLLAGVGVGARVALLDDDGELLSEFVVESADPFESRGRPTDAARLEGRSSFAARAIVLPIADPSLRWAYVDPRGGALDTALLPEAVRAELLEPERLTRYPLVEPTAADWWLVRDGANHRLRPRPGAGGADLFVPDIAGVAGELARIGRAQNLVRLASSAAAARLPAGLELWVDVRDDAHAPVRRLRSGESVAPGSEVRVRCSKTAGGIVDLNVFYVDAHFGVTRLFPRPGGEARLASDVEGEITLLDWSPILDDSLGFEHILTIAARRSEGERVLDLAALAQRSVSIQRSAASDRVTAFLEDLATCSPTRAGIFGLRVADELGFQTTTLDVSWRAPAAPDWPSSGAVATPAEFVVPELDLPPGVPSPYGSIARVALARVSMPPRTRGAPAVLLCGDEQVWTVFVDVALRERGARPDDAALVLGSPAFDPRAAFTFENGAVHAYYRRSRASGFDIVLVDRDGDGLAEDRWSLGNEGWVREGPLALSWLGQGWLGALPTLSERLCATRAFGVLDLQNE